MFHCSRLVLIYVWISQQLAGLNKNEKYVRALGEDTLLSICCARHLDSIKLDIHDWKEICEVLRLRLMCFTVKCFHLPLGTLHAYCSSENFH